MSEQTGTDTFDADYYQRACERLREENDQQRRELIRMEAKLMDVTLERDNLQHADHTAALTLREAVEVLQEIVSFGCCETPGCCEDDPHCDSMRARSFFSAHPELQEETT